MIKQKHGFWLFIFSLIPGAGEMYMGFRKQGISIMLLFWGIIALAGGLNIGYLIMFLPILWFYSFFNVHNLKSLSPEEFYSMEDNYILHLDTLIGDGTKIMTRYRTVIGFGFIVIGGCVLWDIFMSLLSNILPYPLANVTYTLSYRFPQALLAAGIVFLGFHMVRQKKKDLDELDGEEDDTQEHYWEPYRPQQQPAEPVRPMDTPMAAPASPVQETPVQEEVLPPSEVIVIPPSKEENSDASNNQ